MRARTWLLPLVSIGFLVSAPGRCLQLTAHPDAPAPQEPQAAQAEQKAEKQEEKKEEKTVLLGRVDRERTEAAVPEWVGVEVESAPDAEVSKALAHVSPGASVTVYFGTWCSDSRREVSRLWRALDLSGSAPDALPFRLEYVGVDETKKEPADLLAGVGLLYVPTFVVRRGGAEVGRIVEESPNGIESDLLGLLEGQTHGLVTAKKSLLEASGKP